MTFFSPDVLLRTDEGWDEVLVAKLPRVDVRDEARALRFIASEKKIEVFAARRAENFRPFTLFGSGDFHHLSAVWLRQFCEPLVLLSFDNHPDWDIRPPRWSCGAWINRALENPRVLQAQIWGCGNFECNLPGRWLGNRRAARAGRLLVHPWAQGGRGYPDWLHPIRPESWRADFTQSMNSMPVKKVYVTIDLDCLATGLVPTNWEPGRFALEDLTWALGEIRRHATIIGGDMCGAWSTQEGAYASVFQRLAARFDHPKIALPDPMERIAALDKIYQTLWPALTGRMAG